jgi:uncharacterized membrane protein
MDQIMNYLADRIGIVSFLVGIVFFIAAIIMHFFPPKEINYLYGYRTKASMKNQDVWDFSQKYSAGKMFQTALFLIAISFLNLFINISQLSATFLGIGFMIVGCIYMIVSTEKAIKKNFPNQ